MSRQDANSAFARTSFLYGGNASFIEDLYAKYETDPAAVDAEWQELFRSLKDERADVIKSASGASWKKPNWPLRPDGDLVAALDGQWADTEKKISEKISAKAQATGVELSSTDVQQATRDSIHALMLIRAYRIRGHFHAKLDPLGLEPEKNEEELDPRSYGFTEADLDRKIFLDKVLGLEFASMREIVAILRRTYCQTLGVEFMHISNAAQNPAYKCLTPQAVLEELEALTRDKSVYEFLQQEVVDGFHDHEEFVRVTEGEYLDVLDEEVREAMGLVSERQYRTMFERYVLHVLAWTRGERLRNPHTGENERPDEEMLAQTEAIVMAGSEDRRDFRRGLISAVGAYRLEHSEGEIDYSQIFPDLFRRLRDHFFDERKRTLRKNAEKVLHYLGDERNQLSAREQQQVGETLRSMQEKYGYCEHCAKDGIVLLLSKRYTD